MRLIEKRDYDGFRMLSDEAYCEYLESLKRENPLRYQEESQQKREVSRPRFDFYLQTGSNFVAEEDGRVVGYVTSQTVPFMHGGDKLMWIEDIVVQKRFRRRGIGTALLRKIIGYAKSARAMNRIYTTINPDNEPSIKLHSKGGFNVKDWKIASYKLE